MSYIIIKLTLARISAYLIDFLVLLVISYLLYLIGLPFFHYSSTNILGIEINLFVTQIGPLISWLYHSIFECSSIQATPGKFLLSLKVYDSIYKRANFAQTTARHFSKILSYLTIGIGFFMFFFSKRKQCLHDFISCTIIDFDSIKVFNE